MADRPFLLGIVADLGGTVARGAGNGFVRVDRDSLDAVLRDRGVVVEVDALELALPIASMEDFHPDALVRRLPSMAKLLAKRELRPQRPPAPVPDPGSPARPAGGLLDQILQRQEPSGAPVAASPSALDALVRQVTDPLIDRTDEAAAARWRAAVDEALTAGLQAVMCSDRFVALESAWRSVEALVRSANTGPDLQIWLLDATAEEAAAGLADELRVPGRSEFAAVLAGYRFDGAGASIATLAALAEAARAGGTILVADAAPGLLGLESPSDLTDPLLVRSPPAPEPDAFRQLRRDPAAAVTVLCLPQVLLRVPFGPEADPVDAFPYAEPPGQLLFGSAALALGRVLAAAFDAEGWGADVAAFGQIDGLPVHTSPDGQMACCTEAPMTDSTIRTLVDRGFVAVGWYRDQDAVRFFGPATLDGTSLRFD